MIHQLLATKRHMMQAWTKSGVRIPVTVLFADDCTVLGKATQDGRILVGSGKKKLKNMHKPQRSQLEKVGISVGFSTVREVRADGEDMQIQAGSVLTPSQVFSLGDVVKVTGTSKGSGFTGVVKRHGFKGGPRTHGQADRERAPGSIGAGTTPGRVYKNKRMAGRAGNEQVTVEGLQIVGIDGNQIWVKGLIPGAMNSIVTITKVESKEFEGLLEKKTAVTEAQPAETEAPAVETEVVTENSPEVSTESENTK